MGSAGQMDSIGSRAAFFDVDGTIVRATIVHYYAYFATHDRSRLQKIFFWTGLIPQIISFILIDKISRSAFNRVFYRSYRGMPGSRLREQTGGLFEREIRPRLYSEAVARVKRHQDNGERVVLITGSLDFIVAPLARLLDVGDVISVRMSEENGILSGRLTGPPVGDEEKARLVREFAEAQQIDLAESFAYGDSGADMPMLRCVGHPVAVNPKGRLRRAAEEGGWEVAEWSVSRKV